MTRLDILDSLRYRRDKLQNELIPSLKGDIQQLANAELIYVIAQIEYNEKHIGV